MNEMKYKWLQKTMPFILKIPPIYQNESKTHSTVVYFHELVSSTKFYFVFIFIAYFKWQKNLPHFTNKIKNTVLALLYLSEKQNQTKQNKKPQN